MGSTQHYNENAFFKYLFFLILFSKIDDNDGAKPSARYWPIKMTNKRLTKAPKSKMGSKATMDGAPKVNVGAMGRSKGKGGRRVKNDRLSALDNHGDDDD